MVAEDKTKSYFILFFLKQECLNDALNNLPPHTSLTYTKSWQKEEVIGGDSIQRNHCLSPTEKFMEGKSTICPDLNLSFKGVLIFSYLSLGFNLDGKSILFQKVL